MSYANIHIEGGLFPSDMLDRIASANNDIPGQKSTDFKSTSSARLTDEIPRAFADASSHWDSFIRRLERSRTSRTTLVRQDWGAKFFEVLDFEPLIRERAPIDLDGTAFNISHRIHDTDTATPVHIVGIDQELDRRSSSSSRSPHSLVQEYLNRSEALWGITTNGRKLRLLRNSARVSKPTYLEFDIEGMLEGNAYSEFAVLYRLLHATRFPGKGEEPHECLLEKYYNLGVDEGGRVRDKLRDGVKSALETLGNALLAHPLNEDLRQEFRNGRLTQEGYYRQLLSLVYRLLFLMVAEERKLLAMGSDMQQYGIYLRCYGVSQLRDRAERRFADDIHDDLWEGLKQTFHLFRDESAARSLALSPLNGELFGLEACRDIEEAYCPNYDLLSAMLRLSTFDDDGVRRRVNYAHLDVEEFGSVYESLLDYRPVVDISVTPLRFYLDAGTERKQTGSYYTPPELVRELVDSALVPVMEERLAKARGKVARERALLDLRVCDPAAGSGHFLLAAVRRIARELARVRAGEDEPAPVEYRAALRDVVRNCIYAVDKNPLAVDLCKVALWIESYAVGVPLGFLDHHIKLGDSLVGVSDLSVLDEGIPDEAYKAVIGDDKGATTRYRQRNKREREGQRSLDLQIDTGLPSEVVDDFTAFGILEERSPAEVHAKEALYEQIRGSGTRWWRLKTACDLWTYAFFAPLRAVGPDGIDIVPTTDIVRNYAVGRNYNPILAGAANAASQENSYFHWPLEFPNVFESGGFDVVLGNPPWERIKLQEKEFFATRDHAIASAPNQAARRRLIRELPNHNSALAAEFERALHTSEATSRFIRGNGRYPLTGRGDINTYSVFSETARTICGPTSRAGIIVPSGIAIDDTTKMFFGDIVDKRSLVSLYDFENREKVFPGIDSRTKFCLLTMCGLDNPSERAEFAFFLHRAAHLKDAERRFVLTMGDFALFNPNTLTCPVFRTRKDADIAAKMYRCAGVFWKEARDSEAERNPWDVRFSTMFHMSNNSNLFQNREELTASNWRLDGNIFSKDQEHYLPLYEAKLFHQYDHRFATYDGGRRGKSREMTAAEKANPNAVVIPRYWVPEEEVEERLDKRERNEELYGADLYLDWELAVRLITNATNQRTVIAAAIPALGLGHKGAIIRTMSGE